MGQIKGALMDDMTIYNLARSVPDEAQKPIAAGRLKGMTDINPMWRIKRLTEIFGPCGLSSSAGSPGAAWTPMLTRGR